MTAGRQTRVRVLGRGMGALAAGCPGRRELAAALDAMLAVAAASVPVPPPAVELHLLDDARMAAANRRHMACQGPTNILSFPGGADCAGILLLSTDCLRRECLLYGQPPREHALRLLAHGMGHLCGLDHGPEMDGLCALLAKAGAAALPEAGGGRPCPDSPEPEAGGRS